jgi:hypothetical protein
MRRTCWLAPAAAFGFVLGQCPPAHAGTPDDPPDPFAAFASRPSSPERPDLWSEQPHQDTLDVEELFRPEWLPGEGARRKLGSKVDGSLGSLTTQVVLTEPEVAREWPVPDAGWHSDHAWKLDVFGPLSMFGQLGTVLTTVTAEELKLTGRTGLAYKLPVPALDVQLRGGPSLSCTDPQRPERTQAHAEMLVELVARWPLGNGVGLEFQTTAVPALATTDRDRVNHDLRLALPLGRLGQLKVGAKHRWEIESAVRSWTDGTEFYVSLGIGQ